jgi:hypothetical protein
LMAEGGLQTILVCQSWGYAPGVGFVIVRKPVYCHETTSFQFDG